MGHASTGGTALGKAMLMPQAKHTGKSLVEEIKWVSRWDAAVSEGNKQPIQLKHIDIT